MDKELEKLVEMSQYFGQNKEFVIAGGGNTSYKDDKFLWVKGSGTCLGDITIDGFVQLDREKLKVISTRNYSNETNERERQVKADLNLATIHPEKNIRPSVETSLHEIIQYKYVAHTHATFANAILCSKNAMKVYKKYFGDDALYIPFIDPGYKLFKRVETALIEYRKLNLKLKTQNLKSVDPKVILLENHGIFVSADSAEEIKRIYKQIEKNIELKTKRLKIENLGIDKSVVSILPAIRMIASEGKANIVKIRNNTLIKHFSRDKKHFELVSHPFIPDMVVYCKPNFIYIDKTGNPYEIIEEFKTKSNAFKNEFGYTPKVVVIKNIGLIAIDNNSKSAEIILDIYQDLLKVSYYSQSFGGPRFLNQAQIDFIDNWEVENYRRSRTTGCSGTGRVQDKIFIVTGGAQGFGEGIVYGLFAEGANIVIADLKEDLGNALSEKLNSRKMAHAVLFHKTDVADAKSVSELVDFTVKEFGGLDVIISNAGILHAGSLDEMSPETFKLMTEVNYIGYFHCVKYATPVMKMQWQYNREWFMDIIQINSKSGLKGSNKNFAYAGGKFGGIGLTQSFALELMPFNVKVNSICPGNFFDGPLWDDPNTGLFVQYLRTGKVPGAKTIADVKRYYESQVPANRGCRVTDVMKAIYYVIEQEYETGQAIPVTGGQNMLK